MMTSFPKLEEEQLAFWKANAIFQKTLAKPAPKGEFVFYEGPPTANGKPGIHHVLARSFKDAVPRYKTMQGYRVRRKAGWDTHGLPVELQVEKQLEISGKPDIEKYGVAAFNAKCKESVWQYKDEWERLTERMGYWVDLENPYITYDNDYIESVWWTLKQVQEKGLLYQGHKVVPHCPRCGTALSSHEVAQGYKEVKDISVYVKFKVDSSVIPSEVEGSVVAQLFKENTPVYILSWTTTPWTLPGNVGLAVGEDFDYVKIRIKNEEESSKEYLILAKSRLELIEGEYEIIEECKGKDLIGLKYQPLFPGAIPESAENYANAYKVWPASFVTTEDGTGVVHTAVMYGEDDYQLGEQVGLPKHHTVNAEGKFDFAHVIVREGNPDRGNLVFTATSHEKQDHHELIPQLRGDDTRDILIQLNNLPVKHKDPAVEIETTKIILRYLSEQGYLLKKEKYLHDYPFCWRCDTPLLYYAKDSWFIAMSGLSEKLLANNAKVNWVPEHIKDGRFGEWLKGVKDWAISRERYWGTPLPIWKSEDGEKIMVIGSREELYQKAIEHKPTKMLFMRHGEGEQNVQNIRSSNIDTFSLTATGREQIQAQANKLQTEQIDVIIASPVLRTRETAEIIAQAKNMQVIYDDRLQELLQGEWDGKSVDELASDQRFLELRSLQEAGDETVLQYTQGGTGESWQDCINRLQDFIQEINTNYQGKTVLVVTHQAQLVFAQGLLRDWNVKQMMREFNNPRTRYGQPPLALYLDNQGKELDLHKPTLDEVVLKAEDGTKLYREKGVLDVWFDSGAMPYAQWHYPFENKELIDDVNFQALFPADYISEAIDQTRGWFYTLLAVATLLDKPAPYKNVVCLAHINDKHGKKMSKSKGNIVDPWEMMNTYGADAVRLLFYTMNQPGETKNFDPGQVEQIMKKNFLILWNVLSFYQMYAPTAEKVHEPSQHVLDQWILAKTQALVQSVTEKLDHYDLTTAGRTCIDFINELSTWYIRRSRDRFKVGGQAQAEAVATLHEVLLTLAKVMAPFTPFIAEGLYRAVATDDSPESVHLCAWPEARALTKEEQSVLDQMDHMRKIVERALAARAEAGIKVRQPLQTLYVDVALEKLDSEYITILKDEVNVNQVLTGDSIALDTVITPELERAGIARELVRQINNLRKQAKLSINDSIDLILTTEDTKANQAITEHADAIKSATVSFAIRDNFSDDVAVVEVKVNNAVVRVGMVVR